MNVTLEAEGLTASILVTLDTETMDLIEDGEVWGKAWFWIDLTKLPASYPARTVIRNITLVMSYFNETIRNPRVSRVYSMLRESQLKPPKTGLGIVDKKVTISVSTNVTRLKIGKTVIRITPIPPYTGFGLSLGYEAKYGIFLYGFYIDDILSQKFKVVYFDDMALKGEPAYWMILEDTNLDLDIVNPGLDLISIFRNYYLYILFGVLAVLFIMAFLRGRICTKH